MQPDPFAELGLPALADVTDDDVRAAWRRIAAATHPDREDGGDPARFGAAAAAYALLRTSFGRGEALADLGAPVPGIGGPGSGRAGRPRVALRPREPQRRGAHRQRAPRSASTESASTGPPARYRHAGYISIDRRLGLPAGGAALGAAASVAAAGWTPATIGLVTGALTVTAWGLWRRAARDR